MQRFMRYHSISTTPLPQAQLSDTLAQSELRKAYSLDKNTPEHNQNWTISKIRSHSWAPSVVQRDTAKTRFGSHNYVCKGRPTSWWSFRNFYPLHAEGHHGEAGEPPSTIVMGLSLNRGKKIEYSFWVLFSKLITIIFNYSDIWNNWNSCWKQNI